MKLYKITFKMNNKLLLLVMVTSVVMVTSGAYAEVYPVQSKCQAITTPICEFLSRLGYNMTTFPNILNQQNMAEAISELQTYTPLLATKCAKELPYFLCSTYLPYCMENVDVVLKPCRSLCRKSKQGCEEAMHFGNTWPFHCDIYPEYGKGEQCLHIQDDVVTTAQPTTTTTTITTTTKKIIPKKEKLKGNSVGTRRLKGVLKPSLLRIIYCMKF